jgi:CBS domain containing-hemolysin-like protein
MNDVLIIVIITLIAVFRLLNSLLRASYFALGRISVLAFVERAKKENSKMWSLLEDRVRLNYSTQVFDKVMLLAMFALSLLLVPDPNWRHLLGALVYITLFDLFFPNIAAGFAPEWLISRLFPLLRFFYFLFQPFTALMAAMIKRSDDEEEEELEHDDIQAFIKTGAEEGIIEHGDQTWISNIIGLGETVVREVMTPRTDMVCIDREKTFEEILDVFRSTKFSRLPIFKGDIDRIEGVLIFKDFFELKESDKNAGLDSIIKPVLFVPENKRISELMQEMLKDRLQMVIVIDEFGGTAGLTTLEDLIEEIVGEIHDEHEEPESDEIIPLENGSYLIDGKVLLEEFCHLFDIEVVEDGIDTLGGFLFNREGRIPPQGTKLAIEDLSVEIIKADERRIYQVRVMPQKVHSDEETIQPR